MKKKEAKQFPKIKYQDKIIKIKKLVQDTNKCYSYNNSIINKNISNQISLIISKNLKKHSISKKQYNIYKINSIIFEQKNHMVAEFKNYLLWDETSEFLKRFYNLVESFDRLPSISQYYESYTLFAPIYFGLCGPLILIMNDWTRKKKNYLEYIEDKEEDDEKKQKLEKNLNFKKLIKSNLVFSNSSDSNSKKTIELTKYDKVDSFFIKDNKDLSLMENNENIEKINDKNMSLSKIMDEISSNYSIFIANTNKIKKKEEDNSKKKYSKKNKNSKNEMSKKDKNIVLSDKVLFSFTNLYKNRNKKFNSNNQKIKKYHYGTSNNSTSKVKRSNINEKNKEVNKTKSKINMPVNETKNSIKKRAKNNNLQITINNFTRNKIKDKKEIIQKHALTNTNNTNINITSYNSSSNISLSKLKSKKQKLKKLYLRNFKLITQTYNAHKANSPSSNTLDIIQNENSNNNNKSKNIKCNFTRLLTYKDGKYKRYSLNINKNLKNKIFPCFIKPNISQRNNDPFKSKINKLIKEKIIITSANSFSKKNKNNSKTENQSIKINNNKIINFAVLNKKLSNRNLARNLVLSKFQSKKEIVHKSKISWNNALHCKMIYSSLTKSKTSRNSSLTKSKKRNYNSKSNKRFIESLSMKPYKKELNKINLNFNFNINFNIDLNKNRKKKFLFSQKNNFGFLTQRNPILKGNKTNKSKSRGESSHKKNVLNSLIKNMKNDYNLKLKKLSKNNQI